MRRAAARLHCAPASAGRGSLAGGALPAGRGLWCVLPPGEQSITVSVDSFALRAAFARVGRAPRDLSFHAARDGSFESEPVALDLAGTDLARAVTVRLDDDAPAGTLSLRAAGCGALVVPLGAPAAPTPPTLCGYRADARDPIAFAAWCARAVDALLAALADLGARRATLTLSTRDGDPLRARFAVHAGPSAETWSAALRALARGCATSLTLDGAWGELLIAPAPRGVDAVNETALHLAHDAVPSGRVEAARAAVEDALAAGADGLLQAWCAELRDPPRPRCVSRWERARGVRALPMARGWFARWLRADVDRAFLDGAWRNGGLAAHRPDGDAWLAALAPTGAGAGSSRVRALWRRTGGAPLQGGIA